MKNNLNDTESRSVEIQHLLNRHPHWLILKGNFLISIILLFFLLMVSYFVKYPEFVNSKIVIDSQNFQTIPIIGQLTVSTGDIGKVKVGQKVIVRLYNFPSEEFGTLEGRIKEVSINSKDYQINVIFPKGLTTSYHKNIPSNTQLKGNVDIVIQDTSFMEKIISKIK